MLFFCLEPKNDVSLLTAFSTLKNYQTWDIFHKYRPFLNLLIGRRFGRKVQPPRSTIHLLSRGSADRQLRARPLGTIVILLWRYLFWGFHVSNADLKQVEQGQKEIDDLIVEFLRHLQAQWGLGAGSRSFDSEKFSELRFFPILFRDLIMWLNNSDDSVILFIRLIPF